jgi:hypothetical protein
MIPEVRLATAALRACALLLAPAAAVGLAAQGRAGALGAGTGVAIVAALTLASLPLYRWGASRRPDMVVRVAPIGIAIRLGLAGVLLVVVAQLPGLAPTALGVAMVAALLATHVAEIVVASRDARLYWIDPHVDRTRTPT